MRKLGKKVKLQISYNVAIEFYYRLDQDNQRLVVCLITKVYRGLYLSFLRDAVTESYEHYNAQHKDCELIHPDAIVSGG